MAKKEVKKFEKIEREYTIPLREKCRPVPRYKKTPKAIKSIKEFLVRHMKIRERDLKKIKIDSYLNEQIWMRGIKNPIHKVKVRVVKEGDLVRVYSADLPKKINFRKLREEKSESKAEALAKEKKTLIEKAKESFKGKKEGSESSEDKKENENLTEEIAEEKVEEIEKEKAVEEFNEKQEKEAKKKEKHIAKPKSPKEIKNARTGYNQMSRGH